MHLPPIISPCLLLLSHVCICPLSSRFFFRRGQNPFEWYGTWAELRPLIAPACGLPPTAAAGGESTQKRAAAAASLDVLVPGCGNSSLSADMYDAGVTRITNLDFSRVVIAGMLRSHARARPAMRWLVGDMTAPALPDASFDVVVDKGALVSDGGGGYFCTCMV